MLDSAGCPPPWWACYTMHTTAAGFSYCNQPRPRLCPRPCAAVPQSVYVLYRHKRWSVPASEDPNAALQSAVDACRSSGRMGGVEEAFDCLKDANNMWTLLIVKFGNGLVRERGREGGAKGGGGQGAQGEWEHSGGGPGGLQIPLTVPQPRPALCWAGRTCVWQQLVGEVASRPGLRAPLRRPAAAMQQADATGRYVPSAPRSPLCPAAPALPYRRTPAAT